MKCESLMQFWVSLNELHFRVGALGSTKMWSAFTGCYSEPGMWLPIYPTFKIFVEKPNCAEREKHKERDQNLFLQVTFLYLTQI